MALCLGILSLPGQNLWRAVSRRHSRIHSTAVAPGLVLALEMGASKIHHLDQRIATVAAGQHQILRLEVGVRHPDAMQERQGRRRLPHHPGGIGLAVAAVIAQMLKQFPALDEIQDQIEVIIAWRVKVLVYRAYRRMAIVPFQKEQILHFALKGHVVGQTFGNLFYRDGFTCPTIRAAKDIAKHSSAKRRAIKVNLVLFFNGMDVGRIMQ